MSTRSRVIIVGRYQIVLIDLSMNAGGLLAYNPVAQLCPYRTSGK
jgi:hypothetical protein